jgi:hypothetical protein
VSGRNRSERRDRRARHVTIAPAPRVSFLAAAVASALLLLPSCATTRLLKAQKTGSLVSLPERSPGNPATPASIRFANGVVAILLAPFTIVFDVVSFPVQIVRQDPPYGAEEKME